MRQYVLTDDDMKALVEGLELAKLRALEFEGDAAVKQKVSDAHRAMYYKVVKWAQDVAGWRN